MATLSNNIARAIRDFDNIETAIEDMGVEVPEDTSTSSYPQKIREIDRGIIPTGTINITENGNDIDVTQYATANVNVPQGVFLSGNLEITENNTYNVTEYEEVTVAVPQPSGKITLTENATDVDVSAYATADIDVPQGVFPEGTYEISDNGTYDVSEYEFAYVNAVTLDMYLEGEVVNYTGNATEVVERALQYTESLESIDLPNVERVDRFGFANCSNLQSVRLGSCTYLHTEAFYSCYNLESVYIPELTNVGGTYSAGQSGNFSYCSKLTSVDFPKLQNIGVYEFMNSGIASVNLPEVAVVASCAFMNCQSLEYIRLPKAQTSSNDIFKNCTALKRVELPAITSISSTTFSGCTALTAFVIGTRLTYPSSTIYPYTPSFDLPVQTIVYVNNADLGWYSSQSGWSDLYNAGRIKSVDELPPLESNNS